MHQDIRCLLTFQVSPQTMSNLGIFFHAWGPLRRWLRKATRDAAVAYAVALWLEMVSLLAPWNDVCPRCSVCSRLPVEFSTLDRKGDYIPAHMLIGQNHMLSLRESERSCLVVGTCRNSFMSYKKHWLISQTNVRFSPCDSVWDFRTLKQPGLINRD